MSSSADPNDYEYTKPGFFMTSTIKSLQMKFPTVKNISTEVLLKWLETPQERAIALLDARPQEEFDVSHINGAIRVEYQDNNMENLVNSFEEKILGKSNPTVVCYCSLGYRSSTVAKNLQEYYYKSGRRPVPEIYNLAGSIFQWANERRPMVDKHGNPTTYAHPYSSFWGTLLDAPLRKK